MGMFIDGEEYIKLTDFVRSGQSHYTHRVSLIRAVKTLGFPARKIANTWYVNIRKAELWIKARMPEGQAS